MYVMRLARFHGRLKPHKPPLGYATAFDSVPYAVGIESASLAAVADRPLNCISNFLRDSRNNVKIEDKTRLETVNTPTLFNVVMARLPPLLSKFPHLRFPTRGENHARGRH